MSVTLHSSLQVRQRRENPTVQVIVDTHSDYQHIQILKHPTFGHQLFLDGDLQISSADRAYQNTMVSPLIGQLPTNSHVAVLGGGDGGVLNELLIHHDSGHLSLAFAKLIEIDAEVIKLCQTHLPQLNDRIANHPLADLQIGDAFAFLRNQRQCLEAVIYDLTMSPINVAQSQEAFIQETLRSICTALKPNGMLSMQVCGVNETSPALKAQANLLQRLVPTICRQCFDHFEFQQAYIPSFEMQWLFLWAKGPRLDKVKNLTFDYKARYQ